MFSKACEYGIRAVIFIVARSKNGKKVGIKEVCKEIEVPEHFTAKILQNLTRMELIHSTKGPNGGFYVDPDRDIRLIDIVRAIDGNKLFTNCGLGIKECSDEKPCPVHYEFVKIRQSIKNMLESTSVREVTMDLEQGLSFLKK